MSCCVVVLWIIQNIQGLIELDSLNKSCLDWLAVMDGINQSYLCRSLSGLPVVVVVAAHVLAFIVVGAADFCNYQPKWACRLCFHFVGLTTAFFAFYTPIWVGISLASIAVEEVATFQILGKKINPVTKMSRFTRPFGLGVLAPG
jgi:hypothetical protein